MFNGILSKAVSAMLMVCMLTMPMNVCTNNEVQKMDNADIWSENVIDDWRITWSQGMFYDQIMGMTNGVDQITYAYNDEGKRISKNVNGLKTIYTYDDYGNLVSEKTEDLIIEYNYIFVEDDSEFYLEGFKYNDNIYSYVYDGDIIVGIKRGDVIKAEYIYFNDICEGVMGITYEDELAAQLNAFRYCGYYYDNETGWYYLGERYYSAKGNRFIDGISPQKANELKAAGYEYYIVDAKTYSIGVNCFNEKARSNDYDNHPVAKVIQLESNVSSADQTCVAWVIKNRMNQGTAGGFRDNAYDVVMQGVGTDNQQFSTANSNEFYNFAAYAAKETWAHALELENCLYSGNMPSKPYGYDNQIYFSSVASFFKFRRYDSTYFYYGNMRISNAFVLGFGQIDDSNVMLFPSSTYTGKYNVFCNKEFGSYN